MSEDAAKPEPAPDDDDYRPSDWVWDAPSGTYKNRSLSAKIRSAADSQLGLFSRMAADGELVSTPSRGLSVKDIQELQDYLRKRPLLQRGGMPA